MPVTQDSIDAVYRAFVKAMKRNGFSPDDIMPMLGAMVQSELQKIDDPQMRTLRLDIFIHALRQNVDER
jgi:hypothetical protein